jgi:uncharacterized cofD-like protein
VCRACGRSDPAWRGHHRRALNSERAAIRRVFLDPSTQVTVHARSALERSERIILGPGDLYTSIHPTLLVEGVSEAIAETDCEVIYIVSLMTMASETDGFRASDFVRAAATYLGKPPDPDVVHTAGHVPERLSAYGEEGAR